MTPPAHRPPYDVDELDASLELEADDLATLPLVAGLLAEAARWALVMAPTVISYALRPYDGLLDRRRWAWQRRGRCGATPALARLLAEAGLLEP